MIYLTKHSNLSEGLYWAREITGEQDAGRGPWSIVEVVGSAPFLSRYLLAVRMREGRGVFDQKYGLAWARHVDEIRVGGDWEFGPRIDIPSDRDRVEYAPEQAKERVFA